MALGLISHETHEVWSSLSVLSGSLPQRRTIKNTACFNGIGVHSGDSVRMRIDPAKAGEGIVFAYEGTCIKAHYDVVRITPMATTLVHPNGLTIYTIEHVMAAFYGCGITDALVTLEGAPEVPIMDGSAILFLDAFSQNIALDQMFSAIEIIETVEVRKGDAIARFSPLSGRRFSFSYDEKSPFYIYTKGEIATFDCCEDKDQFANLIAPARTFGFFEDGQRLHAMGLARGASLNNTVVLHNQTVMNQDGLRMPNEMLQHKLLDAMGDIFLWGGLIYGHFEGVNTGHALNNTLLHSLAKNPSCWNKI